MHRNERLLSAGTLVKKPFLVLMYHWNGIHIVDLPYYRKLTLHEIKVLEINAT